MADRVNALEWPVSDRLGKSPPGAGKLPSWMVFVVILVAGIVVTAVLAGPVHRWLLGLGWLEPKDFFRVVRRGLLAAAVTAFLVAFRPWRDGSAASYGLVSGRRALALTGAGFVAGATLLVAILAIEIAFGWLEWRPSAGVAALWWRFASFLATGLVVGLFEEWFFRGWLLRRIGRSAGRAWAVSISALLYAALHAFKNIKAVRALPHDPSGALQAVAIWLKTLADPGTFGREFVGLLLVAVLLTVVVIRLRSLWPAVGFHAAAVVVLYLDDLLVVRGSPTIWAGTKSVVDGAMVWLLLALLAIAVWWWRRPVAAPARA